MSDKAVEIEFYTALEIQNIIGCGTNTVYSLMKDKDFPSVKIGRKYYVPKKEFERWYTNKANKKSTEQTENSPETTE